MKVKIACDITSTGKPSISSSIEVDENNEEELQRLIDLSIKKYDEMERVVFNKYLQLRNKLI